MKIKPTIKLTGQNGNAYNIMGIARKAARKDGWTPEELEEYMTEATSGDYDNLLQVTMKYFDVW